MKIKIAKICGLRRQKTADKAVCLQLQNFLLRPKQASALLIMLLLMGLLMTLSLGISNLVIREISVTQSLVDANKAYYAAEAGVENALLGLKHNEPGFEGEATGIATDLDPFFQYQVSIDNSTSTIPDFPEDRPIYLNEFCEKTDANNPFAIGYSFAALKSSATCPEATFKVLGLNETHIIPLYRAAPGGGSEKISNFLVQYYTSSAQLQGELADLELQYFDILRWKIYGRPINDLGRTESIADFYPSVDNAGPTNPVCIGTDASLRGSIYKEDCIFPVLTLDVSQGQNDTVWSGARECYATDAGIFVTGGAQIKGTSVDKDVQGSDSGQCDMRSFIDSHEQNYLVLTNMTNPAVLGIGSTADKEQIRKANIYYRVITSQDSDSPQLVPDFAMIHADGMVQKGDEIRKSLEVKYKAPGFLPVFNFSLYKTASGDKSNE